MVAHPRRAGRDLQQKLHTVTRYLFQERNSDATLLPRNESVEVKPDLRPQGRTISNRQNAEQPIVIIDSEDEASDVPQDAVPQEAVPQEAVHAHTQQQDSNLVPSETSVPMQTNLIIMQADWLMSRCVGVKDQGAANAYPTN